MALRKSRIGGGVEMREILFRGKRIDDGKWVYGHYVKVTPQNDSDGHRICSPDTWNMYPVLPETVGQYTGLKDKNGKKIFEGGIVYAYSEGARLIGAIEYFDNAYCIKTKNGVYNSLWTNAEYYEMVGNVFENIHLLK